MPDGQSCSGCACWFAMYRTHNNLLAAFLWMLLSEVIFVPISYTAYAGRPWNPPLGQVCPSDWLEYQSTCYKRFEENKTWQQARETCLDWEGDLVALTTSSIQEFVYKNIAMNRTLWIGLAQNEKGAFHWANGEALVYKNWLPGEPDSGSVSEKCVEMTDYGSYHGLWNDKPCSHAQYFICQKVRNGQLYRVQSHVMLIGQAADQLRASSEIECLFHCQKSPGCKSANYASNSGVCELHSSTMGDSPADSVPEKDFIYYEKLD